MNRYIPNWFELYELIPQELYEKTPENKYYKLWWLFDPRALWIADRLRYRYGKMIANTWYWKGQHQYRGWRPFDCAVGAEYSQHRFGRAIDLVPQEISVEEIREDIKKDPWREEFKYITCLEENVSWIHYDTRNWDKKKHGILLVRP